MIKLAKFLGKNFIVESCMGHIRDLPQSSKDIPEKVASSLLQTNTKDDKNNSIKWFFVLLSVGIGLTIINYNLPLGFHSIATIAFCISASFLSYFFFIKLSEK